MAGRPPLTSPDIDNLQRLATFTDGLIDIRAIIAYTMKKCGSSSKDIGAVFGISRQAADGYVKEVEEALNWDKDM